MTTDRADEIFLGERLAEQPGRVTVGIAEVTAFLTGASLAPDASEVTRALFAKPHLREAYRAIQARLTYAAIPALAAASDEAVRLRVFPGGEMSLTEDEGLIYVLTRLDPAPPGPVKLLMTGRNGGITLRDLPEIDSLGEIMLILDPANSDDAALLAVLSDPESEGALIPAMPTLTEE